MVDWSDSERLRGFCDRRTDGQTDGQTDICDSRVAFATENAHRCTVTIPTPAAFTALKLSQLTTFDLNPKWNKSVKN